MMPLHATMTQVQLRNKVFGTCTYEGTFLGDTYVPHAILYRQVSWVDSQLQSKQIIVKRATNKYVLEAQ